jgi:hypothetical protein
MVVAGLLCLAHIHVAVLPEDLTTWGGAALLVLLLAAAEIGAAAMLLQRPGRAVLIAAVLIAVIALVPWLCSRTVGLPGVIAGALAVMTLLLAAALLCCGDSLQRRPGTSAHARALMVLAVVAVTFIGIAGTAVTWFDQPGSADNPSISHTHPAT